MPSFSEIMCTIALSHIQVTEVNEQFLLTVYHIATTSYIGKLCLIEAGALSVIAQIHALQIDYVYLTVLCEICQELLTLADDY